MDLLSDPRPRRTLARRGLCLLRLTCIAFLLAGPSYLSAETIDLFSAPSRSSSTVVVEPHDVGGLGRSPGLEAAKRYRSVRLSPAVTGDGALRPGDRLRLDLFPNIELTAVVEHTRRGSHGVRTIRARLSGTQHGVLILSLDGDAALGSITIPEQGKEFALHQPQGSQDLLLQQIDTSKKDVIESPFDAIEPGPAGPVPDAALRRSRSRNTPSESTLPHDTGAAATIDVMVVYTPAASAWASTNATNIGLVISQAMERAQLASDESNLGIDFHLVRSAEVAYVESGDSEVDLDRLTFHEGYDPWGLEGSPRYMEEIHNWRNQYGADLVAFLARVDDTGGLGWLLNRDQGWPELGFHLTRVQQAHWTFTMIHEMGHNMGAHHHKEQTVQAGPGLKSYSAGWRWTGNDSGHYCSIMTYESGAYFSDGITHQRVSLFSTSLLSHEGVHAGNAENGDNARTLRETRSAVVGYRERAGFPDLVVQSPTVDDLSLTTGESFIASATVKNQGSATATNTTLRYYLSTNSLIDTTDTELGADAIKTLTPGETDPQNEPLSAPSSQGTYWVGACVDAVSGESSTSNNCSTGLEISVTDGGGEDYCFADAYRLEDRHLTSGETRYRSEQRLTIAGTVDVAAEATLTLVAPRIAFEPGFKVARGGRVSASTDGVTCPTATLGQTGHAEPRHPNRDGTGVPQGSARLYTGTAGLPSWLQSQLRAMSVDPAAISSSLLDHDDRWLIIETTQQLITTDDNRYRDIYRLDLLGPGLKLISASETGQVGNRPSAYPAADASGELIVFHSEADNLVQGDGNGANDIFLHDAALGITVRLTDDEHASAHPGIDASGTDLVYDQRDASGLRQVLGRTLSDAQTPPVQLSLTDDSPGVSLDNHHPAISADGRFVAYLEEYLSQAETVCQVHIYDRRTEVYHRQPCPERLAAARETARPMFTPTADQVLWYLPSAPEPIQLANPLHKDRW